ncbi:MAG: SelB C-terminal domain-containing protein, partial [Calditrichota bacterium]
HGVVAITKSDLADEDWLKLVEDDVRGLLANSSFQQLPIIRTSAETGEGIDELRDRLRNMLESIPPRHDTNQLRLPIDRVFSIKGFGTVLAGTLLSGSLETGAKLQLLPSLSEVRVRGLQSHDSDSDVLKIGNRAAVNVVGVDAGEIHRGMALIEPETFPPVEIINAQLSLLQSAPSKLKNNQRIRLHIHTAEVFARVLLPFQSALNPGEEAFIQLKLEEPLHAAFQDRFIIRQYSPQNTIGGGVVLQVNPLRYRKKYAETFRRTLENLASDDPSLHIIASFDTIRCLLQRFNELRFNTGLTSDELKRSLKKLISGQQIFRESGKPDRYLSAEQLRVVLRAINRLLDSYHKEYPGRPGLTEVEIVGALEQRFDPILIRRALKAGIHAEELVLDTAYRLKDFQQTLSARDSSAFAELEELYRNAALTPPSLNEAREISGLDNKSFKEVMRSFRDENLLIPVADGLLFYHQAIKDLIVQLKNVFSKEESLGVPAFKELTGTTRKHAIPLLTWLDKKGYTRRDGDLRYKGDLS